MVESAHRFDAGRVSLDLLETLGARGRERLPDAAALGAWLHAADLVEAPCGVDANDLACARALRDALFRVVEADLHGHHPSAADVDTINEVAAASTRPLRLMLTADGLRKEQPRPTVSELLAEIARDALDLLTGPERDLLRECAAEDCSGIYVDASPARTRRWCSTARCGNRARVAAHRARRARGHGPAA